MKLVGILFELIPQNIVLFFPDTVKCFLQSSNGESLVANIITFNVVTMALNVWAQARTFKIVLGSFLSIYNAFQTILCFPK